MNLMIYKEELVDFLDSIVVSFSLIEGVEAELIRNWDYSTSAFFQVSYSYSLDKVSTHTIGIYQVKLEEKSIVVNRAKERMAFTNFEEAKSYMIEHRDEVSRKLMMEIIA